MPFTSPRLFTPAFAPPAQLTGARLWFVFRGRRLLVSERGELPFTESLAGMGVHVNSEHYLGTLGEDHCVTASARDDAPAPEGAQWLDLRQLLPTLSSDLMGVAGRAVQVVAWQHEHRYCGACATETEFAEGRRAKVCPACGLECFPRLAPAIIVSVERGDEILLARSPHFPPGIHSALAGFVDPGESVEDCVHREVKEEVGIEVKNLRYFSSQPWPFPNSLMLGFQAEWASGDIVIDDDEIESADFFPADDLPPIFPGRFSISQWLLADFLKRHGHELP